MAPFSAHFDSAAIHFRRPSRGGRGTRTSMTWIVLSLWQKKASPRRRGVLLKLVYTRCQGGKVLLHSPLTPRARKEARGCRRGKSSSVPFRGPKTTCLFMADKPFMWEAGGKVPSRLFHMRWGGGGGCSLRRPHSEPSRLLRSLRKREKRRPCTVKSLIFAGYVEPTHSLKKSRFRQLANVRVIGVKEVVRLMELA